MLERKEPLLAVTRVGETPQPERRWQQNPAVEAWTQALNLKNILKVSVNDGESLPDNWNTLVEAFRKVYLVANIAYAAQLGFTGLNGCAETGAFTLTSRQMFEFINTFECQNWDRLGVDQKKQLLEKLHLNASMTYMKNYVDQMDDHGALVR